MTNSIYTIVVPTLVILTYYPINILLLLGTGLKQFNYYNSIIIPLI